jgi:hypothetical protein
MKIFKMIRFVTMILIGSFGVLQSQTLQSSFPVANGSVYAITSSGTTVFLGGSFTTIGDSTRNGLAAVNGTTGAVLSWDPNPVRSGGTTIKSLVLSNDGNSLFVGGNFQTIGGQTRNYLAKVDIATGNADATWDPKLNGNEGVEKMSLSAGDTLYFYGKDFTTVNDTAARGAIAAVSATGAGVVTAFNPDGVVPITTRYIQVSPDGSTVYIGYNSLNIFWSGQLRNYFAALNTSDGSVTDMNPGFNQGIFCGAVVGDVIYFGGQFISINGNFNIQKIAKFDASGGWSNPTLVTNWNNTSATTPDGDIRAIIYSNSGAVPLLYLGGGFHDIDTVPRERFAAIKASDATVQSWDLAGVNVQGGLNMRMHLSTVNHKIYVADFMTSILGTNRSFIAAVDGGSDPLPVELVSLTASSKVMNVELKWKTATEINNYGFEIERSRNQKSEVRSQNTTEVWSGVGFVEGSGTSNALKEYSFTDKNILTGRYSYRLKQIDRDGKFSYSQEVEVTINGIPKEFTLEQNYPNPFNPTTNIEFTVPVNGRATLKVFNEIGQEVATLFDGITESDQYHQVTFNAANLSSGMYFVKLQSGERTQLKKMMLLK